MIFFPSVLELIPTASLAAILVFTGFKLIEVHHIERLAEYGRFPLVIYAATIIGIVAKDLLTGVMIGLGLTVLKVLWKVTRLEIKVVSGESSRRVDITLRGVATFLRLPKLQQIFDGLPMDRIIHLHIEDLHYVDHTCFEMLQSVAAQRAEQGGAVHAEWETLAKRFHLKQVHAG